MKPFIRDYLRELTQICNKILFSNFSRIFDLILLLSNFNYFLSSAKIFCCRFCFTIFRELTLRVPLPKGCRRIQAEFTIQIWNINGDKLTEDEFKYDVKEGLVYRQLGQSIVVTNYDEIIIFLQNKKWIKN